MTEINFGSVQYEMFVLRFGLTSIAASLCCFSFEDPESKIAITRILTTEPISIKDKVPPADNLSLARLPQLLLNPKAAFEGLASDPPSAAKVLVRLALWLGLLPPLFAWVGMAQFGWRLGAVEPIFFPPQITLGICALYFLCLLFGFISTGYIAHWMSITYGASRSLGAHFGLITIVGAPLTIGSVMHLYPHVFLNLIVLVPCLIWSMILLYQGLPIALSVDTQRGMLMASSIIGYLFVAFVSLLGISAFLWTVGIGPRIGI